MVARHLGSAGGGVGLTCTMPGNPKHLSVWIVQNGEELPTDPGEPRLLRQYLLARELVARGHSVTFWATTFNHQRKFQRPQAALHVDDRGVEIRLLKAGSYAGNVSIRRIRSHQQAARRFRSAARRLPAPDVLVAGYPSIELAHSAVTFAFRRGIPSLVDLRDQWPDIIEQQASSLARRVGLPLLRHWRRLRNEIIARATAVGGISDLFVLWGLSAIDRPRSPLDVSFPLAPPRPALSEAALTQARRKWSELAGVKTEDVLWGAYAGNLSHRTDILTVARAAAQLSAPERRRIRLVICGSGSQQHELARISQHSDCVVFAGHCNAAEVQTLLEQVDFGMIPYLDSSDFLMSYPNKVGELLSFGLPILTCLGGITGDLLETHRLDHRYRSGDVDSCVRALQGLLEQGSAADTVRSRAISLFANRFDPAHVYPAYADHVERVATQKLVN